MKYISTRGRAPAQNFEGVLLTGLAPDGGLYVPQKLPSYSAAQLRDMATLPYAELAKRIIVPFVDDTIPAAELGRMIDESYAEFRHDEVTPLIELGENNWVMELFHGPTLAFKDVALQLLGRLFEYVLEQRDQQVVILGATSGDTGSAAIEGCRHSPHVDIFILHPHERVSDVQRRQMTTIPGANIHNIALQGNFDHCQALVKQCFSDQSFLPDRRQLVAVNSINWARIMAQIVYYFYAALRVGGPEQAVSFSVPTGNFGDIFAGYLARCMGLPIDRLDIAPNQKEILHRCLSNNDYSRGELSHTLSPSMDIMISSNFERLLFDLYDRNGAAIEQLMADFAKGPIQLTEAALGKARALFDSYRVDDAQTCDTIRRVYQGHQYLLDPHSAIGYCAAHSSSQLSGKENTPMVTLATAHPAKFSAAIQQAGISEPLALPEHLADLLQRDEHFTVLADDKTELTQFITANLSP